MSLKFVYTLMANNYLELFEDILKLSNLNKFNFDKINQIFTEIRLVLLSILTYLIFIVDV